MLSLFLCGAFLTACGGGGGDGGSGGGAATFDPRLIGQWEFQEILGAGGSFTLINVERITFVPDFTGIQETFSVVNGSPSATETASFTWSAVNASTLRVTIGPNTADASYSITSSGDGMQFGGRVYSRLN